MSEDFFPKKLLKGILQFKSKGCIWYKIIVVSNSKNIRLILHQALILKKWFQRSTFIDYCFHEILAFTIKISQSQINTLNTILEKYID